MHAPDGAVRPHFAALARRLQAAVRESDTVGRIGGDEFVVVLDGLENELGALAPLERMAAMLAQPVDLGGQGLRLTVSIGVAVCPRDGDARAELLRYADLALYRAKQTGRDRIVFYAEDMNVEAQDRLWLERELTAALEHDLVFLHYQPRYALDRLQLAGFEQIKVMPLRLYVFWKNPLNYVGLAVTTVLELFFRACFVLYGKDVKVLTKKLAAVCRNPG